MRSSVKYRKIYGSAAPDDGVRILIGRLWPRGLRREEVHRRQLKSSAIHGDGRRCGACAS